jgi:hypothetical protein
VAVGAERRDRPAAAGPRHAAGRPQQRARARSQRAVERIQQKWNRFGASGVAYYRSPQIPWQYTWNAAVFYEFGRYVVTFSGYNLTNRRNWQPSSSLYGNDFLVQNDPRTFELRLQVKF